MNFRWKWKIIETAEPYEYCATSQDGQTCFAIFATRHGEESSIDRAPLKTFQHKAERHWILSIVFCFRFLNFHDATSLIFAFSMTVLSVWIKFWTWTECFCANLLHNSADDLDLNKGYLSGNEIDETTSTHPSMQRKSHAQLTREIASLISWKKVNASVLSSETMGKVMTTSHANSHQVATMCTTSSAIVSGKVQVTHATQICRRRFLCLHNKHAIVCCNYDNIKELPPPTMHSISFQFC